jgi:hypothetical protein
MHFLWGTNSMCIIYIYIYIYIYAYTGCGKLTSFFIWIYSCCIYSMSVNDWCAFGDKIQGRSKAYKHITGISEKSNSQIQNWRLLPLLPKRVSVKHYKLTACRGNRPLHWESRSCRWSGLLALPTSLHVTSLCEGCVTSTAGNRWTELENFRNYRDDIQERARKRHLSGHEWRSLWA